MTDNEIIKSLSVHRDRFDYNCFGCSYRGIKCSFDLAGDAFDLINRQKAEIEELQSELIITKNNFENAKERYDEAVKISQKMNEKLIDAYKKLQTAKSEAYKEFAERLKAYFNDGRDVMYLQTFIHYGIDRLIKELSEVSDNA